MDGVSLPYLPISLWILTGAMTILILLVAFGFYVHWRNWAKELEGTGSDVASLEARKLILEKEKDSLEEWIRVHKDELDRVKAEREEQEHLRAVLADLEQQCATKNQENQVLRNEVGELENQRHQVTQTLENLKREIGDLDAKRADKEALDSLLAQLRPQVEESQKTIHNLAAMKAMLTALTSQKEALEKAIEDLRSTGEMARVETERLRNDALQARTDLEQITGELLDSRNQKAELDAAIGKLREKQHSLNGDIQRLEEKIGQLKTSAEKSKQEAQLAKAETERAVAELEQVKGEVEVLLRDTARAKVEKDEMNGRKPILEREINDLRSDAELARTERDRFRSEAGQARIEADQVARELVDAQRERVELGMILDAFRLEQQAIEGKSERLEEKIEGLNQTIKDLGVEARKAQDDLARVTQAVERAARGLAESVKDRERVDSDCRGVKQELGELNAQKAALKQEISGLEREIIRLEDERGLPSEAVGDPLAAYEDLINEPPACLANDHFAGGPMTSVSEEEALDRLQDVLGSTGLHFPERVLKAFHTSLKVNDIIPLTVLAGVSGTGKSLLPVKYAEVMGMHSLIVSVQPRWDSPQDLFGFYNYLEHKYKATELARSLVRMDEHNFTPEQFPALGGMKRDDRMLLVLLDEMNLARTEYYFSEFLSKLEFRKFSRDPSKRSQAEIVFDTGPRSKDAAPFRLWVGGNVLFVGTMNEDESTQTLSDKVLDRANVLRFGKPPRNEARHDTREIPERANKNFLPYSTWQIWLRKPGVESWHKSVDSLLVRLNDALNLLWRPFGYRVEDAIHAYIANYPGVDHNAKLYKTALADQVELKLLPKLRGIEVSENVQPLNGIKEVIRELEDEELLKEFENCLERAQNTTNLFAWRGVERPM